MTNLMGVTPSKTFFDFLFIVTPQFKVPPSDGTTYRPTLLNASKLTQYQLEWTLILTFTSLCDSNGIRFGTTSLSITI